MCLPLKWGALEWIYYTHCNYVHRCGIFQLSSEHMIPWSHPFYSYKGDLRWANHHLSLKETTQWKSNVKMSGNQCLEYPKWTRRKQWTDLSLLIVQVSVCVVTCSAGFTYYDINKFYSQTKSSVPPKILLMNWLFEKWIC